MIVQSDRSLLLEVGGEAYAACRDDIAPFCELLKSPEHVHTYRISPLSLWNAAAAGWTAEGMVEALRRWSRFDLPSNVVRDIEDLTGRYGRLQLVPEDEHSLRLVADDPLLLDQVRASRLTKELVGEPVPAENGAPEGLPVGRHHRGELKRALVRLGWPVEDLAGYVDGGPLQVRAPTRASSGPAQPFGAPRLPARGRRDCFHARRHRPGWQRRGRAALRCGQDRWSASVPWPASAARRSSSRRTTPP